MNTTSKSVYHTVFHIILVLSAFAMLSGIAVPSPIPFFEDTACFEPLTEVIINREPELPMVSSIPDGDIENACMVSSDGMFGAGDSTLSPVEKVTVASSSYSVTPEEFRMLCCVIQREVANLGEYHKKIIANVILNRVKSNRFPDTISEVLHQKNQFPTIVNYYDTTFEPDETTIKAVTEVLSGQCPDLSKGALSFYNPKYTSKKSAEWFEENLEYLYTIDCHRFFRYKQ